MLYTIVFKCNEKLHANLVEAKNEDAAEKFFKRMLVSGERFVSIKQTVKEDVVPNIPLWYINGQVHGMSSSEAAILQNAYCQK